MLKTENPEMKMNYKIASPSLKFRVGRNAEEEKLHQLSCEYWKSPITRQRLGLPDNETIRRAVLSVDRRDGVALAEAAVRAANRSTREQRMILKRKIWVKELPGDHVMTPIARLVAEAFALPWEQLFAGGRETKTVFPRQAAMTLLMEERKWSTAEVAAYFGKKDHTTVLFAVKAVKFRADTEPDYAAKLAAARAKITQLKNQTVQPTTP